MQHALMDLRTLTDSSSRILNTTDFQITPFGPATNPLSPVNPLIAADASTENEKVSATAPVMSAFAPRMTDMGIGTRLDAAS